MTILKSAVLELLGRGLEALGASLSEEEVGRQLGRPPSPDLGDMAFGCFPLARTLRRSPAAIAGELAAELSREAAGSAIIASACAKGPYVNFRVDPGALARRVLPAALEPGYGSSEVGLGKSVVIDFSSPNVAKPFGIGHLRSTAIGAAVGRLLRARGYRVIGINHLGDWGTQFGKLIVAWRRWGDESAFEQDAIQHLYELYVRFHDEEAERPELTQAGRDWFRRLEEGDAEARALWERFRDASLAEFERIYQRMGVDFDYVWGESFYEDKLPAAIERIEEAGILEDSEGAKVVSVETFYPGTSPCLILRSDGATLYTTRDVAAAIYRHEQFEPERMLYVTGADQADHFRKVFGTLKRMGFEWADGCIHVPFGRIHGISTRKGTLVFLEDVFDRARDLSLEMMRDRDMSPEEARSEAEKVGVGAVVFFDLSKDRIKDADFDWDAVLKIQGRTGPGLQYTGVRLKSVLEHYRDTWGELPAPETVGYDRLVEPEATALVQSLDEYGEVIERAAGAYEPAVLSRYLLDLVDLFNSFYSTGHRIVSDDPELSAARITLCRALLAVLESGLTKLGVPLPERM